MSHKENDRCFEQQKEREEEPKPMKTHTPTPWRLHERSNRAIIAPTGHLIAEVTMCNKHIKTEDDRSETEANAAFIVTACNVHDDLVKALKDMLTYEGMDYNDDRRINAIQCAKEALKNAGVNV